MKKLLVMAAVLLALLGFGGQALAHGTGPSANSDSDGMPSGREHGQHHIAAMAQMGMLGEGGHKPGAHHGYSVCLDN